MEKEKEIMKDAHLELNFYLVLVAPILTAIA